jgi:hypothetical protein
MYFFLKDGSLGPLVFLHQKTFSLFGYDIAEILLKVALSTKNQIKKINQSTNIPLRTSYKRSSVNPYDSDDKNKLTNNISAR